MSKWQIPPAIKIYEALGAIADERIIVESDKAEVYSSEGNKKYDVVYSEAENAIMANDNGSYWVSYLGYPSIAFLMLRGKLDLNRQYTEGLSGIEWKKVNTKNKNDFEKTQKEMDGILEEKGINLDEFYLYLVKVSGQMAALDLDLLGTKTKPPKESEAK